MDRFTYIEDRTAPEATPEHVTDSDREQGIVAAVADDGCELVDLILSLDGALDKPLPRRVQKVFQELIDEIAASALEKAQERLNDEHDGNP